MSLFDYTAKLPTGEIVKGQLKAGSEKELRWVLIDRGLQPEFVREATAQKVTILATSGERARSSHIELTLRQISVMLRSGLTLLESIETVIEQPPSRAVKRIYERVREDVENGSNFAESIGEHKCFPDSVTSMVAMGEESGNLDSIMERCAIAMETSRQNKEATITALFYPVITLLIAFGTVAYMVIKVIPEMKRALAALGRKLPWMTQSLLDMVDFFSKWGLLIGGTITLFAVVFFFVWKWPPGRLAIDKVILRIPLIGTILRTSSTALFARSMGTLINSGIPLVEGLRILGTMHSNYYLRAVIESARRKILEGGSLAESLNRPNAYTPMMQKMVAVGEVSGNLEETLGHVANFHDMRLQALVKKLSAVMEPVVIIVVGIIVGYVFIAFFLGLYGGV